MELPRLFKGALDQYSGCLFWPVVLDGHTLFSTRDHEARLLRVWPVCDANLVGHCTPSRWRFRLAQRLLIAGGSDALAVVKRPASGDKAEMRCIAAIAGFIANDRARPRWTSHRPATTRHRRDDSVDHPGFVPPKENPAAELDLGLPKPNLILWPRAAIDAFVALAEECGP